MRLGTPNLAQKVIWATAVQIAAKVVGLLSTLVVVKLTTNYLGVDGFGELSIVIVGSTLVLVIADLGLGLYLARELAKSPERADELGGTVLFVRIVTAVALMAISGLIVPFLPYSPEVRLGLLIGIGGVLIGAVSLLPIAFFQVHLRLEFAALSELMTRVASLLFVGLVIIFDLGFLALVGALVAAWVVNLGLTFALSRRYWRINLRFDLAGGRRVFMASLPIGIVTVLGLINFRVDAVMISLMKPAEDVGIYAIAFSFLEQSLLVPVLFMAAVFPIITRYVEAEDPFVYTIINLSFRFLLLASVPIALLAFVLAEPLVLLVSSDEFIDATRPLQILAFAIIPAYANATYSQLMISIDRLRPVIVVQVIALAVNVGLNIFFIEKYTYIGAAATTVFSQTLGFVMVFLVAHRAYSVKLDLGSMGRVGAAALASGGVVWALAGQSAWLTAIVATVVFVAVAVLVRAITPSDVRLLLGRQVDEPDDPSLRPEA